MNKNIDMLSGSLADKILLYALPLAATAILQQLFNVADVAVVGQFVGKEAMAAVGSNSPIINLLVNLFTGIALGSNVVIAQAIGRKDPSSVKKVVHTSILFAVLSGIVLTGLGEVFAPHVLEATKVPSDVIDMAVTYLRIYMLGMPVILLYNYESAIFRAKGDTKTPLMALMLSGIINVGLNLLLVLVFHLGVAGVAIATVTSNLISSALLFIRLLKSKDDTGIRLSELRISRIHLKQILKIGLPAGVQSSMFSLANILIQSAINSLGSTVMAGASAAFNIEVLAFFVMNAFSQAITTFVGQNYGAGNYERCRKVFFTALLLDYICTAITCGLLLIFGRFILGLFNSDPEVIEIGYERLQILFFAYILHTLQDAGSGYLRGFGRSLLPAINSLVCICGIRILWIFTAFRADPTFRTIMMAYPVSLWTAGIVILIMLLIIRPSKRYAPENIGAGTGG